MNDRRNEERDWTGAALVGPSETLAAIPRRRRGTFFVWRARDDAALYMVTGDKRPAAVPAGHDWTLVKRVPETGQPRVGFSEAEAKADIAARGFHLRRIAEDGVATVSGEAAE